MSDRTTGICVAHGGANQELVGLRLQAIFDAVGIGYSDAAAMHFRLMDTAEKGGDWIQHLGVTWSTMSRQVRIFRIFLPPPYNVVLEHFLLFQFPYSPPLLCKEG
jgi:hypothetical protein